MVDTSLTTNSISLESGLITLSINTSPTLLASPAAAAYSIHLDHLVTLHFLDPIKFDLVKALIDSGDAYSIITNPANGKLQVEMRQTISDICMDGLYSCAIRNDIIGGAVVNPYSVYPFATGFGTSDDSAAVGWITTNLLGANEFATELATNMTAIVNQRYNINNKGNQAWYINPGYKWAGDNSAISDKVIIIAVMVLDDGVNFGNRRLLSVVESHTGTPATPVKSVGRNLLEVLTPVSDTQKVIDALAQIAGNGRTGAITPIDFEVDVAEQLANILTMTNTSWAAFQLKILGRFSSAYTEPSIVQMLGDRLTANILKVCESCFRAIPVFNNLMATNSLDPVPVTSGRRLLQNAPTLVTYNGTVTVMVAYTDPTEMFKFSEMFNAVLNPVYTSPINDELTLQDFVNDAGNMQFVLYDIALISNHTSITITDIVDFDMEKNHAGHNHTHPDKHTDIDKLIDQYLKEGAGSCVRPFRDYPIILFVFLLASMLIGGNE
jgi:hypothetical protein